MASCVMQKNVKPGFEVRNGHFGVRNSAALESEAAVSESETGVSESKTAVSESETAVSKAVWPTLAAARWPSAFWQPSDGRLTTPMGQSCEGRRTAV